jgi:cobalamin biosynthesis protein CobT
MKNLLSKYEILDFKDTNETGGTQSGMQAMFVREKSTGKKILLFRGTEFKTELMNDFVKADGYMALGGSTQQMQDARAYANKLKNIGASDGSTLDSSTVITGHSLGGSLTQNFGV